VRAFLIGQLRAGTFTAFGDEAALTLSPYDSGEKKIELDLEGCLACTKPLEIDGKPRFVTTRVPKSIAKGRAVGLDVGFPTVSQPDQKAAAEWSERYGQRLKVEFVFRVGALWKSGPFDGVAFVPLAWRVVDRCSGSIFASEPPSQGKSAPEALALKDASCPEELSEEEIKRREWAALPDQLSPKQINGAMATARDRVHDCAAEFESAGTATVKMVVGQNGAVQAMTLLPPFDKTPTGYCIKTALKGLTFPKFKGERMIITYPFQLQ
jgi:hypothetical protein